MSAVLLSGSILTLFCVSDSGCDASVVLICCQLTTSLAWRPQLGGLRFTVHVPDEVDFKLEIRDWRGRARAGGRDHMAIETDAAHP